MSALRGLITLPRSRYMDRYFGCSFFTTFFLREKESGGKKSAYKGDCAAIRCAPIRRKIPLIYPPMTALPIATVLVYTRNSRQALSLPFLKEMYHVCCFSFSRSQSVYTRFFNYYREIYFFRCDSLYTYRWSSSKKARFGKFEELESAVDAAEGLILVRRAQKSSTAIGKYDVCTAFSVLTQSDG